MRKIHSDIIAFRGTHYDFGYEQGVLLKDSNIIKNRDKQWEIRRPRFSIDEQEAKQAITAIAPMIWEELRGFQDALGWPMEKVLQEFGGYRIAYQKSGCSIFTSKDYMIRNYDYHPKTYEGRYTLFQPSDNGYAIMGPSQRVTGRMDGMNEKGLVLGYNFMHRKEPGDGFICHMIGRLVLETCANVTEAINLLKEIPHRHSFSYIVLDPNGETYIVEATPREVRLRLSHLCTNHFEKMTHENRRHLDDSKQRLEAMEKQQQGINNAFEAYRMMNDSERGVFSKDYKSWSGTIHTSAYFPKTLQAWFALGDQDDPVVFDFAAWLEGTEITSPRIWGEIDTDMSFGHMDENVK